MEQRMGTGIRFYSPVKGRKAQGIVVSVTYHIGNNVTIIEIRIFRQHQFCFSVPNFDPALLRSPAAFLQPYQLGRRHRSCRDLTQFSSLLEIVSYSGILW